MKTPERKCKINGLHVTEITVQNLPNVQQKMEAIYALGEIAKKGEARLIVGTHGRCTAYTQNWSKSTMKLLEELLNSMEEDLLPRHFEETAGMEDTNERIESRTDEDADQI